MNKPELADKNVRRALAYLTNVDDFLETYYAGFGQRHSVPVFLKAAYYNHSLKPPEFDLDELIERLIFVDKVEKGLKQLDEGKTVPHDEVKKITKKW